MQKTFTVNDKNVINDILDAAEYGTLALCYEDKPYALPINFVTKDEAIYFHGAKKGKKMEFIKTNANASFSVVESLSLLPSYFSNDKGDACPATQLFKSVTMEGVIHFVEEYDEKVGALQALMEKLQKEGSYIPLHHAMYEKAINATAIFKLIPKTLTCKAKLGQNFTEERYQRVAKHLGERGSEKDLATLKLINTYRKNKE